jgi:hypothetical protein
MIQANFGTKNIVGGINASNKCKHTHINKSLRIRFFKQCLKETNYIQFIFTKDDIINFGSWFMIQIKV